MTKNRIVAVLGTLAILASSVCAAEQELHRPAPKLVYNLPGKPSQDLSQFRGKVVALEFIFTTCPHCKAASHLMSKLQTEYGPKGLQVIDVAVNDNADLFVEDFAKEQQTTFPVGWAPPAQMLSFMGFNDGRYVVPQLVLIDKQGIIHFQTPATENEEWDKLMSEEVLRKNIEKLLHTTSTSTHPAKKPAETAGLR